MNDAYFEMIEERAQLHAAHLRLLDLGASISPAQEKTLREMIRRIDRLGEEIGQHQRREFDRIGRTKGGQRRHRTPSGFLVDLLVPPDRAEDMLYSLEKTFQSWWVPKYGTRRARQIFIVQSIGSVLSFWIEWTGKRLNIFKYFAR